jgi:hypothetical protein
MPANTTFSRRGLLTTIGAGAVAGGVARGAKAQQSDQPAYHPLAQKQLTKAAARYQDQPHDGKLCAACPYFIQPGSCVTVEGAINPSGWCPMFSEFSALDRGAHA